MSSIRFIVGRDGIEGVMLEAVSGQHMKGVQEQKGKAEGLGHEGLMLK